MPLNEEEEEEAVWYECFSSEFRIETVSKRRTVAKVVTRTIKENCSINFKNMNSNSIFRMCNKRLVTPLISRGYGYKVVKRPDPKTLKMPTPGSAPSLMEIIKEKIRLNGPLTVAEYMHIVTTNPTEGYYMKKEVIGEAGDFITSPEISQLFGEILGIWFCAETQKMGNAKPLQIVELGPGKGTLLVDILRVINRLGFKGKDVSLHLVEISSTMQSVQAHRLCISHKAVDIDMPHNYEKTENGWRELLIDLDESEKLRYRISGNETNSVKMLIRPPINIRDKAELEISARSLGLARQLAQRVDEHGGIALIADYGHEGEKGDTFRAFQRHKVVDPLENPGSCDLTADVDFSQLRIAASKTPGEDNFALVLGPVKQKEFLERSQAEVRLQVLLESAKTETEKEKIQAAYDMLVDPKKMGERFKFMAFYPSSMAAILKKYPPLGFSPDDIVK